MNRITFEKVLKNVQISSRCMQVSDIKIKGKMSDTKNEVTVAL